MSRSRENIDLFAVGDDGQVYTAWWRAGEGSVGLDVGSLGGRFAPDTAIAAVSRSSENIDLFGVDNDGRVTTAWWRAGEGWAPAGAAFSPIGEFFAAGTPVSAVARAGDNSTCSSPRRTDRVHVMVARRRGVVARRSSEWWEPIGGNFPRGAPVAAISRSPEDIDLYATQADGRITTSWWRAGDGWSR